MKFAGGLLIASLLATATMANDNVKAVTKANNEFTNRLYTELAQKDGNVFFSPMSVHNILSLVHQGAEGATESAMRTGLGIPDKAKSADGFSQTMSQLNNVQDVILQIANKVYLKTGYTMKPSFKDVATKSFYAGAENVDFSKNVAAAGTINKWVEEQTKEKIKDLISPDLLDNDTRMVLVNAIYFKGEWEHKFDKANTKKEKFHISETETVDCDMMHMTRKFNYKDDDELDAQVLKLNYKNKDISMVVVLPRKKDGIKDLEAKLKNYDLTKLTENMGYFEVILSLPKFKIETTMNLNDPLKKIGFENMFSDSADFRGLLDSPEPLQVSDVVQKAFIEVNEEGAEAAAATGVVMMMRCMPLRTVFTADRPFVFAVTAGDQALFHGKLATPTQ